MVAAFDVFTRFYATKKQKNLVHSMIQWFVEPTTFSRNNLYKGFVYDIISLTHHCDGILTHSYLVASLH